MLIACCGPTTCLERLVPKDRRKDAKQRAEEVAEGGTAAKAVAGAMQDIQGAILASVAISGGGRDDHRRQLKTWRRRRSWHTASRSVVSGRANPSTGRGEVEHGRRRPCLRDRQRPGRRRRRWSRDCCWSTSFATPSG